MRLFILFLIFVLSADAADKSRFEKGFLGVGVGESLILQRLDVNGAIRMGTTEAISDGTIRFDNGKFQLVENDTWKNILTETDLEQFTSSDITSVSSEEINEEIILTFNFSDSSSLTTNLGNLIGAPGKDGVSGMDGSAWLTGSTSPTSGQGVDGDFYLETDSYEIYVKSDESWSSLGIIKGADGKDGEDVDFSDVNIDGGSIDGVIIGASSPSSSSFTSINITDALNLTPINSLPLDPSVGDLVHRADSSLWLFMSSGWNKIAFATLNHLDIYPEAEYNSIASIYLEGSSFENTDLLYPDVVNHSASGMSGKVAIENNAFQFDASSFLKIENDIGDLPDSDFTFEFVFSSNQLSTDWSFLFCQGQLVNTNYIGYYVYASENSLGVSFYSADGLTTDAIKYDGNLNDGVERHIVVERFGEEIKGYINGVEFDSIPAFDPTAQGGGSKYTWVGVADHYNNGETGYFKGSIRNIRLIKGQAIYEGKFPL